MPKLEYVITGLEDGPIDSRPEFGYDEKAVIDNRNRILNPRGIESNLVRMAANHGTDSLIITEENLTEWSGRIYSERPSVDGLTTNVPDLALECDPADCGVYILFSKEYRILSVAH